EDGPVAVRLVDALADVGEEAGEGELPPALPGGGGPARVDGGLAPGGERGDPVVAGGGGAGLLLLVERADLVAGELAEAVVALLDHLEAVHLEDVAVALVDEQAADGELDAVVDVAEDLLRVAPGAELGHGGADAQPVHLGLVVDGQGV